MVLSLYKTVTERGSRVAKLVGYGNGVSIERVRFQVDREALTIDYAIIPDDDGHTSPTEQEIHVIREQRRLTRSVECVLPSLEGWEVQVSLKASSEEVEQLPWSAHAIKTNSNPSSTGPPDQILLRFTHAALLDDHSVLKVKLVIEASGGTRGLRLNGLPKKVHDTEQRDPSSYQIPQAILQDIASAADLSVQTSSSVSTVASGLSTASSTQTFTKPIVPRTPMAEKSILSRVRRNYIYFSSLLQEPEAKWRRTTEGRGVSITQLDSIDPTLVVYRAEATFVGVGLWDLYGAVVSPGARVYWDKQHDDAVLLEDVNELSELWYFKSKPAWPVQGRDSVVLKTVYKSPNVIHVFAFSAEDPHLFSNIPPVDPNTIRTQVDLQGWSIEALSPTTTSLTLLEQSDPKGWTNKTSIPTNMINTLAGIGEFAIKCGGPPIVTRLTGAKANEMRYDHEKGSFRVEYEASSSRRAPSSDSNSPDDSSRPSIECEIRCDVDTWATSLDIVVDPPPQTMSCLRRHRLSSDGGGLWLTLTHDCVFVDDERLLVLIRRAPGKEKGLVMVNGAKIQVDVEEIPEHELKALSKQKRVKPPRVPLDQPPVVGVVRKRRAEWNHESTGEGPETVKESSSTGWASAPRISSPLSRLLSYAVDQATTTTQQYVAAITPANSTGSSPSATKLPMQYVLEALAWTQDFHNSASFQSTSPTDGWTLVSDKGVTVLRKTIPEVSPIIPVHKGFKVIEGASAEELASVIADDNCRKIWDDRFDSARTLESYGNSCRTLFLTAKGGFPFRDRGFYLASVTARTQPPAPSQTSSALSRRNTNDTADQTKNALFVVQASFSPESITPLFSAHKYNFYNLPIGRMYLDAWVLETLDPYTTENYAIPSTRCTRLVAVDYAGSIPAAVNSMINASLPHSILSIETCFKSLSSSLPLTRLPAPCVVLAEKKGEDRLATVSWKLRKRDENRLLLQESYATDTKVYQASLLVTMASSTPASMATSNSTSTVASNEQNSSSGGVSGNGSHSAPNTAGLEAPTTPRLPQNRALSPRPRSRAREGSEATIVPPPVMEPPRSRTSSSSSSHKYLESSSSTETLRSVRSHDAPLNIMPGTIMSPALQVGSPGDSLLRPFRQRSASSTDGRVYRPSTFHAQYATTPSTTYGNGRAGSSVGTSPPAVSHTRGRTVSNAFTAKGEIKPLKDLVVGEMVVDTRLYPDGYSVVVRSRLVKRPRRRKGAAGSEDVQSVEEIAKEMCLEVDGKDKGKGREGAKKGMFIKLGSLEVLPPKDSVTPTSAPPMHKATSTDSTATVTSKTSSQGGFEDNFLPISYTIFTMPSSPLHSSSLNPEGGTTRHLLRMTLPTAQYWSSSVRDPLTGEIRNGPPKPDWLKVLEGSLDPETLQQGEGDTGDDESRSEIDNRLKGVVVDVEIRPVVSAEPDKDKTKGEDKDKKRKRVKKVKVNGLTVSVVGEKESLSILGRDALLNERTAKMVVLSRYVCFFLLPFCHSV
ncbi:hypothetical protein CC1G_00751 [Coprinopsis cinerea okayama7|uniref:START domain-containing protein n=1 Tax=Coprinopsis cinerea (strain Okayama-7 / 130 / ATCC MYA-4618 / FGSC 9003) TaxID=240176 RepID=A8N9D7_COPC7|nr:hypothetical protein CC1G_00751 [Coprinopsis cinerea okayama7\|eukprot:XP_001831204.2 hypothetical protein CC1G_00751 [Coprinopsis cinerea okayama7\